MQKNKTIGSRNMHFRKISATCLALIMVLTTLSTMTLFAAPAGAIEVLAPVADANGPYTGLTGDLITFDGSGSTGTIALYEWDFDGDGTYDWSSASTGIATHTYSLYGTYYPVLRVTDPAGLPDTDSTTAVINQKNPELLESCGIDIALVLDSSGSIDGSELVTMKNAFISFVDVLMPSTPTQMSVTDFDNTATVVQAFTSDKNLVIAGINTPVSGGCTNWEDGLIKAHSTFDPRVDKPDLVIIASDGNPNTVVGGSGCGASEADAVAAAVAAANAIKADGIRIITLGIGSSIDSANLIAISSADAYFESTDFDALEGTLENISSELCGGTITVRKWVDDLPAAGWEFTANVDDGYAVPASGITDADGYIVFTIEFDQGVTTALVDIIEAPQFGYTLFDAYAIDCDTNPVGTLSGTSILDIPVTNDCAIFAEFLNEEHDDDCPPTTNKTFDGPTYPAVDYPNPDFGPDMGEHFWLTTSTDVTLTAVDCPDEDPSGIDYIHYEIWWDSNEDGVIDEAVDTKVADETVYSDVVTFNFQEECLHLIKWYAADLECNVEETHYQYHRVDDTGPNQTITLGQPQLTDYYLHSNGRYHTVIGPNTPIYITSDDTYDGTKACAVGSSYLTYIVNWGDEWGSWDNSRGPYTVYDGDPEDIDDRPGIITVVEYMPESCWHEIHVWCEDLLGNEGIERWLDFIVDADGPEGSFEYIGPGMWVLGEVEHYIHCSTIKRINGTDIGCIEGGSGVEYIYWKVQRIIGPDTVVTIAEGTVYDGDETYYFNNGLVIVTGDHDPDYGEVVIEITVLEHCEHYIWHQAVDHMGNEGTFYKQKVRVDCKPPITTKTIGQPQYDMGYWVTTSTLIELDAVDQEEPCMVGVDYICYRYGYDQDDSGDIEEDEFYEWVCTPGTHVEFYFTEECLHRLEWYAVDLFGNAEEIHVQYHKVDDTPPDTTKTIGNPKYDFGYWVTTNTLFELDAVDLPPDCPSGVEEICYRIGYDANKDEVFDENEFDPWVCEPTEHVEFYMDEECYHVLEWYSVDNLGHIEETHVQYHRVDDTPPVTIKTFDGPTCGPENFYVTTGTAITLTATDYLDPCAVGVDYIYYEIWWDQDEDGVAYGDTLVDFDTVYDDEVTIFFTEECLHLLRWFAVDYLGNVEEINEQWHKVDDTPPVTTKSFCGNTYGPDDYWVTTDCMITLNAVDYTEPCTSGVTYIYYEIWWDSDNDGFVDTLVDSQTVYDDHVSFNFTEECLHEIRWYAVDCLGNTEEMHYQQHRVDDTPPETLKSFTGSTYDDNYWLTCNTRIFLDATDKTDPCAVGVEYLFVEVWYYDHIEKLWFLVLEEQITGDHYNFTIDQDCLHEIRWYAVDYLGNIEQEHIQQHRVDCQPPETTKTINNPECQEGYYVTTSSLIELDAVDKEEPCAVGVKEIHYRIAFDANENNTFEPSEYGDWVIVLGDHAEFYFAEECYHKLEWFAVDHLGNTEQTHEQYHRVDNSSPVTIKSFEGPTCQDNYFVTTDTTITLTSTEYTEPCAVGGITLHYEIWWDSDNDGTVDQQLVNENIQDDTVSFKFTEECLHEIRWFASDCLGNTEQTHTQQHRVDDSFPIINKTVGDPNCVIIENEEYCVTTDTIITIDAYDPGFCYTPITVKYRINGGSWVDISDSLPFDLNFTEECQHTLEIEVSDCLGHVTNDFEIFYVDDSAPIIDKVVGDPQCVITENEEYCITTTTPIYIDAYNDDCCDFFPVTVDYQINGGDWKPIQVPYTLYIEEECNHTLTIRAKDCLGNTATDTELFHVDDQMPIINKTVGDPNCALPDTDNYCVTTDTQITIDAYDPGCCDDGSFTVKYQINGGGWIDITDQVPFTFNFTEECEHILEITATDCFGREAYDYEVFYVDDTAPIIDKVVGDPNCEIIADKEYCITTSTPIYIDVYNDDCCDFFPPLVEYQINGGDWIPIQVPYTLYIEEECNHTLIIRAKDCLGNTATDTELFHVDDQMPIINKTVGDPNCVILENEEYCVTTQTPITIDVYDPGCCENFTVKYQINDGGYIDITDQVPFIFNFTEECQHILDIWVYDCLGRNVYDTEIFYVDDSAPIIEKTVGEPQIMMEENVEYCITTSTPIYIDVYNDDCCDFFPPLVEYQINGGDWIPIQVPYTLYITEECNHTLIIRAKDCLGNTATDTELFHVDDSPPVIVKTVGEPNCPLEEIGDFCVNLSTEITVEAYDQGCCPCEGVTLEYRIWFNNQWTSWLPYEGPISFNEQCKHFLEIKATDCLGNSIVDNETFFVDEEAPDLEKTVSQPRFYLGLDDFGHDAWQISPMTEITFEAINNGCCDLDNMIMYRYWYLGHWTDWMIYYEPISFSRGCVHYLEAYAVDCLGNKGELDNETFWVCAPGGQDAPDVTIIDIIDHSSDCENYVEVLIEVIDETPAADCLINLWQPLGSGNDDLYYDVFFDDGDGLWHAFVDTYMYKNGTVITLNARAIDGDGNWDDAIPVDFTVINNVVYDQWMTHGWNMLILPPGSIACDDSVESVLASIDGSYEYLFYFNLQAFHWESYVVGEPHNSLETMDAGPIYWVYISGDGLRFYTDTQGPIVSIISPYDGYISEDCEEILEILGTACDVETGVATVTVRIYDETSGNWWTGSDWGDETELPCTYDSVTKEWFYDNMPEFTDLHNYTITATATDMSGCQGNDQITFSYNCYEEPPEECDPDVTYTTDADFNGGTLVGTYAEMDTLYLEIGETTAYPTLWIANAGEDSLSKWDTNTNKELARYHTWFGPLGSHDHDAWDGAAPSRTCVDAYGNCYIANRDFDHFTPDVIKVYTNDWVDRNGNGVLDTSFDANDDGTIVASEMLPMTDTNTNNIIDPDEIVDERIAWATMVDGGGKGRSLSIDLDGNIWLGCFDSRVYYKLDGDTGAILGGPYSVGNNNPYGSLVDKYGYLWGSDLGNDLLKMNTSDPTDYTVYYKPYTYGIALGYDSLGNTLVYCGGNSPWGVFNSSSETYQYPAPALFNTLGIATDSQGNIVCGSSSNGQVAKFAPNGTVIWHVSAQVVSEIRGIVVDSDDNVWAVHRGSSKLCKYDGTDGTALGIFDSGLYPYTYSDAAGTGFAGSVSIGTWTETHDSQAAATIWNSVTYSCDEPEGTSVVVKVRSSEDQASWSPWETVTSGDPLSATPDGRYIQVEVTMQSTSEETPALFDLTIDGTCAGEPQCTPGLELEKTVWREDMAAWDEYTEVEVGEIVTFNITIHIPEDGCPLFDGYLDDLLPFGLEYVDNSTSILGVLGDFVQYEEGEDVNPQLIPSGDDMILRWTSSEGYGDNVPAGVWVYIEFEALVTECGYHTNIANGTGYFDVCCTVSAEDSAEVWVECEEPDVFDFGDAPYNGDNYNYPTLLANNGARHGGIMISAPYMGVGVDPDPDGQPTAGADGDDLNGGMPDDEDGITFYDMYPGELSSVDIDMTWSPFDGYVNAWIDFNADGDWADAGEQIFTDLYVTNGTVHMGQTFAVPSLAVIGDTYARFRISSQTGLSYNGAADDGEVEDYKITIEELSCEPTWNFAKYTYNYTAGGYIGAGVAREGDNHGKFKIVMYNSGDCNITNPKIRDELPSTMNWDSYTVDAPAGVTYTFEYDENPGDINYHWWNFTGVIQPVENIVITFETNFIGTDETSDTNCAYSSVQGASDKSYCSGINFIHLDE